MIQNKEIDLIKILLHHRQAKPQKILTKIIKAIENGANVNQLSHRKQYPINYCLLYDPQFIKELVKAGAIIPLNKNNNILANLLFNYISGLMSMRAAFEHFELEGEHIEKSIQLDKKLKFNNEIKEKMDILCRNIDIKDNHDTLLHFIIYANVAMNRDVLNEAKWAFDMLIEYGANPRLAYDYMVNSHTKFSKPLEELLFELSAKHLESNILSSVKNIDNANDNKEKQKIIKI